MFLGFSLCCLCTSEAALPQGTIQKAPSGAGANLNSESINSKFGSIILKAEKASYHRLKYGISDHSKELVVTKSKRGWEKRQKKVEGERARIGFDKQEMVKAPLFYRSVTEVRSMPSDLNVFVVNKENEAGLFTVSGIYALYSLSLQTGDGKAGRGILMHTIWGPSHKNED